MNIDRYLQRIHLSRPLLPTLSSLHKIQEAHLFRVPFENLDIQLRIPIVLDTAAFYRKIVGRNRGGYCYECNGLLHELLLALGFESRMVSCRIAKGKKPGRDFDHLALIVTVDSTAYLVDAGYGDFSLKPLLLHSELAQHDGYQSWCIRRKQDDAGEQSMYSACKWSHTRQEFLPEYIFSPESHPLEAFAAMNEWHQHNLSSHFVQSLICSKPVAEGRISLLNNRLIKTTKGLREEVLLQDDEERRRVLRDYFDIIAPGAPVLQPLAAG